MTDCNGIALLRCEGLLCDDVLGKQAREDLLSERDWRMSDL